MGGREESTVDCIREPYGIPAFLVDRTTCQTRANKISGGKHTGTRFGSLRVVFYPAIDENLSRWIPQLPLIAYFTSEIPAVTATRRTC